MFLLKVALNLVPLTFSLFMGNNNNNRNNDNIRRELSRQIEELKREKERINEINSEHINKIKELEKMMADNIEEQNRKEIQRKIELEEEKKKERLKKIEEINKRQENILRCREILSDEFSSCILNVINDFNVKRDDWILSLEDEKLKMILERFKEKLTSLFNELFSIQGINEKINNKFINLLNENANFIELTIMNFLIIGTSGVGKSTLINQLLGEEMAEEGTGQRCTKFRKRYISKKYPFISFTDSMGTEIGRGHDLEEVEKDTLEEINNKLNSNDPNEHIHGIIYCTTSNRFFEDELHLIQKIRAKYDGKKLPIIIVYTRASDDKEVESMKNAINDFLKKYNEKISNEIFGIEFMKVMAREKKFEINGQSICLPCFGLSNLISRCYIKGQKVYKIALKNSLIQIAKNSIYKFVNEISIKIANYINYFFYLQINYEPNFSDYIAYCFEKITDIDFQKGINIKELDKLDNYVNKNINIQNTEDTNINSEQNNCMLCNKKPINPYCCDFCGNLVCEKCYLEQFQYEEEIAVYCLSCNCTNFNNFQKEEKINKFNEENNYDNNNEKILENNLKKESKNKIENYCKEFKQEMLKVVNEKFDEFTKNASQNIYYAILDKYRENALEQDINIHEAMKSKEELTDEAANIINKKLKESLEETFLSKNASSLYQYIASIFQTKTLKKIDEFIDNLNNNQDFINFIQNNGIFDENKNLKIEEKFKIYIKNLQEKENKSQENAVKLQYKNKLEESGESSYGSGSESISSYTSK